MAKCNSGLHMIFVGNKSGEQAVCELTAEELKEVINTMPTRHKADKQSLKHN